MGHLHRGGPARVRDRYHDVDIVLRPLAHDLSGQLLAHAQSSLVNGQIVDNRIRPGKVHELENARRTASRSRVLPAVQHAIILDEDRLARVHIAQSFKLQYIERDGLRGDHVFCTLLCLAAANHDRSYAVGIAECDQSVANNHRHYRVTA